MSLPQTLAGTIGLIIFVVFILGISANDIFPDESQNIKSSQEEFTNSLNQSVSPQDKDNLTFWQNPLGLVGLDGIYDFIRNFFSIIINFIVLTVKYLLFFVGITTILPTEMYLFFSLIGSGFIISIVKLIFLSGD